jgi:sulfur relay (sulfurtransferase) DsrC/TusE family protein
MQRGMDEDYKMRKTNLKQAIRVEMEHKPTFRYIRAFEEKYGKLPSDRKMAAMIAKNHIREDPRYYQKLKKMRL